MTALYADDPDVHQIWPVYDFDLTDPIDYVVTVRANRDSATDRLGVWEGVTTLTTHEDRPATMRLLRVPLTELGSGLHGLRGIVAGANDLNLGAVHLE